MAESGKLETVARLEKRLLLAMVYAVVSGGSLAVVFSQITEWRAERYDTFLAGQLVIQAASVALLLLVRGVHARALLVAGYLLAQGTVAVFHYGSSMSIGLFFAAGAFVAGIYVDLRAAAVCVGITIALFVAAAAYHVHAGVASPAVATTAPWDVVNWGRGILTTVVLIFSILAVFVALHQGALRAAREASEALGRERREREERRAAEAALAESQRQEIVSRIAAGAAHDINNVMTAVMGSAELAALEIGDPVAVREYLTLISDSAARTSAMARELLAFARSQVTQRRRVSLAEIVEGLRGLIERLTPSNVEVVIAVAAPETTIFADPAQVEQVVLNLCVNARDAMPEGGRLELRVFEAALREGRPAVGLAVVDSGTGIPDDVRERMFEPFFTTKEDGRGTGLGLATVRIIVDSYGGEIACESRQGEGTAMTVLLPRAGLAEKSAVDSSETTAELPRGAETVLVCDDDPNIRKTARRILEGAGYRVRDAADGATALRVAATETVDLVVIDAVMPGMHGRALYEALKSERRSTHFLFCTGYDPGVFGAEFFDDSRHYLLAKPYGRVDLLRAVRLALDGPTTDRPEAPFAPGAPGPEMKSRGNSGMVSV